MNKEKGTICEFRYITENDCIDLDTLMSSQNQFSIMMRTISREIEPKAKLKISVTAIKHNSFDIQLLFDAVEEALPLLVVPPHLSIIKNVFKFLQAYIKLRSLLGGKKPVGTFEEEGDQIIVIGEGNEITVNKNVYNNYCKNIILDSSVRHGFSVLKSDNQVRGIEILPKGAEIIEIKADDFGSLSAPNELIKDSFTEEVIHTRLVITRAVLFPERKLSWGFIYDSRKINAMVKDNEFNQRISKGELSFGHGDRLEVDLKITREYNSTLGSMVEKSFEVIYVKKIIPAARQTKIDLNQ